LAADSAVVGLGGVEAAVLEVAVAGLGSATKVEESAGGSALLEAGEKLRDVAQVRRRGNDLAEALLAYIAGDEVPVGSVLDPGQLRGQEHDITVVRHSRQRVEPVSLPPIASTGADQVEIARDPFHLAHLYLWMLKRPRDQLNPELSCGRGRGKGPVEVDSFAFLHVDPHR
jgi:hypothetical protein